MSIQGVDLEIIGRSTNQIAVLRPKSIKINGVETALPEGAQLHVNGKLGVEPITVTITMLARSVSIRPLDADDA